MVRRIVAVVLVGLWACGGTAPAGAPTTPTGAATASAPQASPSAPAGFDWLLGAWQGDGTRETWVAAGDALFGVSFAKGGAWEVLIIDTPAGGTPGLTAMPGGRVAVRFPLVAMDDGRASFENPAHDFPQRIAYERDGDALAASVSAGAQAEDFAWRAAGEAERAAALAEPSVMAADRAFAAAVAAGRTEAWVAGFDAQGAMWRDARIEGHDAVRATMAPLFADGSKMLEWTPRFGGVSPAGDLGYTVGDYELVVTDPASGARSVRGRGAYVTVWRKQPDGAWKVLFDTGNLVE